MSTLLQTLNVSSDRILKRLIGNPGPTLTDFPESALTDLHDGSDSTYTAATAVGDGVNNPTVTGWDVGWLMDTAAAAGIIDFVRVKIRAAVFKSAGGTLAAPHTFGVWTGNAGGPPGDDVFQPGAASVGTTPTSVQIDLATDNLDSSAWTNARINSYHWGFDGQGRVTSGASVTLTLRVYEYVVEIWGEPNQSLALDVGAVTAAGANATPTPASAALALGVGAMSAAGVDASVTPGAPSMTLDVAALAVAAAEDLSVEFDAQGPAPALGSVAEAISTSSDSVGLESRGCPYLAAVMAPAQPFAFGFAPNPLYDITLSLRLALLRLPFQLLSASEMQPLFSLVERDSNKDFFWLGLTPQGAVCGGWLDLSAASAPGVLMPDGQLHEIAVRITNGSLGGDIAIAVSLDGNVVAQTDGFLVDDTNGGPFFLVLFNGAACKTRCDFVAYSARYVAVPGFGPVLPEPGAYDVSLPIDEGFSSDLYGAQINNGGVHSIAAFEVQFRTPPDGSRPWGDPPTQLNACMTWRIGQSYRRRGVAGTGYRPRTLPSTNYRPRSTEGRG